MAIQLTYLLLLSICLHIALGVVNIKPSLTRIQDSNTPLSVQCTFDYTNSKFQNLITLTMTKKSTPSGPEDTLVAVTSFRPNSVTKNPNFFGTSAGEIRGRGQNSFLEVEILRPKASDAGTYTCKADGVDANGQIAELVSSTTIQGPGSSSTPGSLKQILDQLNSCRANLLANSAKTENANGLANKLARNAAVSDKDILGVSEVFNSKSVYMVTDPALPYADAKRACDRHEGYLVEINSEDEYQFVSGLLRDPNMNLPSDVNAFITGAYFDTKDQPFQFLTNKEQRVYTGSHFLDGQPDRTGPPNNWLLLYNINGKLGFADGPNSGTTRTFVCEVQK